jgi:hypothetical protein
VLEVGIVLQVPTPSALSHTWTLKWVYKELGSATFHFNNLAELMVFVEELPLHWPVL